MVTVAIALITLLRQDGSQGKAVPIVQKMLQHYADAKSLSGTINLMQEFSGNSVSIDTLLQYERPSKLYVLQKSIMKFMVEGNPAMQESRKQSLVTSDGTLFSYNTPADSEYYKSSDRFIERVTPSGGNQRDLSAIYGIVGSSLLDKSAPLDILISRNEDLKRHRAEWLTFVLKGKAEVGGATCDVIEGNWIDRPGSPMKGLFQMAISPDGDLKKYVIRANFPVGVDKAFAQSGPQNQILTSVWLISVKVGGSVDNSLFSVVK